MWLRTNTNLINLDNVEKFDSHTRPNKMEFVYANFSYTDCSEQELVCICQPDKVQPLLNAIADALVHGIKVFSVPEWLDDYKTDKDVSDQWQS